MRLLVVFVPVTAAVLVAASILLVALFMGRSRQQYALRAATCIAGLAKAMTGIDAPERHHGDRGLDRGRDRRDSPARPGSS